MRITLRIVFGLKVKQANFLQFKTWIGILFQEEKKRFVKNILRFIIYSIVYDAGAKSK